MEKGLIRRETCMKQVMVTGLLTVLCMMVLGACGNTGGTKPNQEAQDMSSNSVQTESGETDTEKEAMRNFYTVDTAISDVKDDSVFGDYGRLIFPVDTGYYSGNTLGELRLTRRKKIQGCFSLREIPKKGLPSVMQEVDLPM